MMLEEIVSGFVPFIVILVIAVIVFLYWWGRKSTKHPDYALAKEKEFDSFLEGLKKYAPDYVDAVLDKVRSVDAVGAGQAMYARLDQRLNTIEAKVNELLTRVQK